MKFTEKNAAKIKLQSANHVDADKALLQKKDPGAKAILKTSADKLRLDKEILWDLLEVATVEEIEKNRAAFKKPKNQQQAKRNKPKRRQPQKKSKQQAKKPRPKSSKKKENTQTFSGAISAIQTFKKQQ